VASLGPRTSRARPLRGRWLPIFSGPNGLARCGANAGRAPPSAIGARPARDRGRRDGAIGDDSRTCAGGPTPAGALHRWHGRGDMNFYNDLAAARLEDAPKAIQDLYSTGTRRRRRRGAQELIDATSLIGPPATARSAGRLQGGGLTILNARSPGRIGSGRSRSCASGWPTSGLGSRPEGGRRVFARAGRPTLGSRLLAPHRLSRLARRARVASSAGRPVDHVRLGTLGGRARSRLRGHAEPGARRRGTPVLPSSFESGTLGPTTSHTPSAARRSPELRPFPGPCSASPSTPGGPSS